jgi:hypothetical protein
MPCHAAMMRQRYYCRFRHMLPLSPLISLPMLPLSLSPITPPRLIFSAAVITMLFAADVYFVIFAFIFTPLPLAAFIIAAIAIDAAIAAISAYATAITMPPLLLLPPPLFTPCRHAAVFRRAISCLIIAACHADDDADYYFAHYAFTLCYCYCRFSPPFHHFRFSSFRRHYCHFS